MSTIKIFSIIKNVTKLVNDEDCTEIDLYKNYSLAYYNASKPYLKSCYKRINNDLENHYYTYDDMILYILYDLLFKKGVNIGGIVTRNIRNVKKIFSKSQLEEDKTNLLQICKKGKISYNHLFEINEDGESLFFKMIQLNHISPMIYLYIKRKKPLTFKEEDAILLSNEYTKFKKIMNLIYQISKEEFNG